MPQTEKNGDTLKRSTQTITITKTLNNNISEQEQLNLLESTRTKTSFWGDDRQMAITNRQVAVINQTCQS